MNILAFLKVFQPPDESSVCRKITLKSNRLKRKKLYVPSFLKRPENIGTHHSQENCYEKALICGRWL